MVDQYSGGSEYIVCAYAGGMRCVSQRFLCEVADAREAVILSSLTHGCCCLRNPMMSDINTSVSSEKTQVVTFI